MNLQKCNAGHFYNVDRYAKCPYCEEIASTGEAGDPDNYDETMSLKKMENIPNINISNVDKWDSNIPNLDVNENIGKGQYLQNENVQNNQNNQNVQTQNTFRDFDPLLDDGFDFQPGTNSGPDPVLDPINRVSNHAQVTESEFISNSNSNGFYNPGEDWDKTISFNTKKPGVYPVVGWLVCIEGNFYGKSFELRQNKNYIGRSSSSDIILAGDVSVSREKHAIIIYEPKSKIFIAQPGESKELYYINDKVVLGNEQLKAHDVLTIGREKLILIPLCGKNFDWEDMKDEQ